VSQTTRENLKFIALETSNFIREKEYLLKIALEIRIIIIMMMMMMIMINSRRRRRRRRRKRRRSKMMRKESRRNKNGERQKN
jgi:choline-glycine betaine transporter